MSFLDTVRAAAATPTAQFNTFLIEFKPNAPRIYGFIEGRQDPSFYRRLISDKLPAGYTLRLVSCGNRNGVIQAIADFLGRYAPNPRVIALIDKDHSDLVPGSRTCAYLYAFQTTHYSIENYLCDASVARRFCVEHFGLTDLDKLVDDIEAQYTKSRDTFHLMARRMMAWIIAARRRGDQVNLNNVDTSKCFTLDADLLPVAQLNEADLDAYLEEQTGAQTKTAPVPKPLVDSIVAELANLPPKVWMRGKQELWHIAKFLEAVAPAVAIKGVRAATKVSIGAKNAAELLSSKCDTPTDLDSFLRRVFAMLTP